VLDGALACIARVGLSKTTLDDVARAAGCSRATLYRRFPGKGRLVHALVAREAAALAATLEAATAGCETLTDAVTVAIVTTARAIRDHAALQFVLAVEPEVLLPHLTFDRADQFLERAGALVAPALTRFLAGADARRLGEWTVRMVLSYLCSPSHRVDLTDDADARALVESFVIPGFALHSDRSHTLA
jgi:AcrR family transcriptional regulator